MLEALHPSSPNCSRNRACFCKKIHGWDAAISLFSALSCSQWLRWSPGSLKWRDVSVVWLESLFNVFRVAGNTMSVVYPSRFRSCELEPFIMEWKGGLLLFGRSKMTFARLKIDLCQDWRKGALFFVSIRVSYWQMCFLFDCEFPVCPRMENTGCIITFQASSTKCLCARIAVLKK